MSAPRERPMLFSGPMVRALLRETAPKTVTRRLINPASAYFGSATRAFWDHAALDKAWVDGKGLPEEYLHVPCHRGDASELDRLDKLWAAKGQPNGYREQYADCGPCKTCDSWGWRMTSHRLWCRVKPGDRIWVRETWCPVDDSDFYATNEPRKWIDYRATPRYEASHPAGGDQEPDHELALKWRPAIHMPRHASRLTMEVLSVKAERLQDITEEDILAEGVTVPLAAEMTGLSWGEIPTLHEAWRLVWDQINGKRALWESNPWVWRYELRRVAVK